MSVKNVDGSEIPGVLRSVPHTLGLSQSTNPQNGVPAGALGWSGDGAPRDGALRNFAVGAVVQHMPKSLNRKEGTDFRLPTASELDALEAFQLSLGRSTTPIVNGPGALVFVDPDVKAGQTLFHGMPSEKGVRNCSFCHNGGGALNAPLPAGRNDQRATGAERSPRAPACTFPVAPGDGGFGPTPVITADRSTFCTNGATGRRRFPRRPVLLGTVDDRGRRHGPVLSQQQRRYARGGGRLLPQRGVLAEHQRGQQCLRHQRHPAQPVGGVHARAQRAREHPG